jgi:hypothetical protein
MKFFLLLFVFLSSIHLKSTESVKTDFPQVSELFQKYLNETNTTSKDYQLNLLKNRNHDCFLKNYENLIESEIRFSTVTSEDISKYFESFSFNENLTNSTHDLFENSVSLKKR